MSSGVVSKPKASASGSFVALVVVVVDGGGTIVVVSGGPFGAVLLSVVSEAGGGGGGEGGGMVSKPRACARESAAEMAGVGSVFWPVSEPLILTVFSEDEADVPLGVVLPSLDSYFYLLLTTSIKMKRRGVGMADQQNYAWSRL